jgi:hypothetical protein
MEVDQWRSDGVVNYMKGDASAEYVGLGRERRIQEAFYIQETYLYNFPVRLLFPTWDIIIIMAQLFNSESDVEYKFILSCIDVFKRCWYLWYLLDI